MNLYMISGLGADERAFKFLQFPAHVNVVYIQWLTPLPKESMQHYAQRLSAVIETSKPFVLLGMSFGGMLATEMLAFVQPVKTILLSSAARKQELPLSYRFAGFFRLHKLMPAKSASKNMFLMNYLFGLKTHGEKILMKDIVAATNEAFSKWAVDVIVRWQRADAPQGLIRIHGSRDRVLPIRNFVPQYIVANGGHFMVVNRAEEVSAILAEVVA